MDLNDNSNWVGLEESDEDEYLSDFANSDEENIDDDYFKKYVDVGVEDVLDEVVRSSQLMMVEHNETEQRNTVEDREENVTVCYLTMNQRRLKKLMLMD